MSERNYPSGEEVQENYPIGKVINVHHPNSNKIVKAKVVALKSEAAGVFWTVVVQLVDKPSIQLDIYYTFLNRDGSGTHLLTGFEDPFDLERD
ncbi:MAG: hypothetical protein HS126_05685 [Anaerolineales bacterium]|nr:hypothetical protein [Anaerolineales bacterium]